LHKQEIGTPSKPGFFWNEGDAKFTLLESEDMAKSVLGEDITNSVSRPEDPVLLKKVS